MGNAPGGDGFGVAFDVTAAHVYLFALTRDLMLPADASASHVVAHKSAFAVARPTQVTGPLLPVLCSILMFPLRPFNSSTSFLVWMVQSRCSLCQVDWQPIRRAGSHTPQRGGRRL